VGGALDNRVLKIGRTVSEGTGGQWEKIEATRYLCASACLSRTFRNNLIRMFIEDKHYALATRIINSGINMAGGSAVAADTLAVGRDSTA